MNTDNLHNNLDVPRRPLKNNGLTSVVVVTALLFALQTTILALMFSQVSQGRGALNNPESAACVRPHQNNPKLSEHFAWDCDPTPIRVKQFNNTIERV